MKRLGLVFIALLSVEMALATESLKRDSISKIQLCLILDVSGSMDGLLSQARNEIWKTISFLEKFQKDGLDTQIEIAIISYGNRQYSDNAHLCLVTAFTSDIEKAAEHLWLMHVGGENEYAGAAIEFALQRLEWNNHKTFKCLLMAGNESFNQGEVSLQDAVKSARKENILLNTIYCGDREMGISDSWELAASLGEGSYSAIDQELDMDQFKTPYDQSLIEFYYDHKSTYLDEGDTYELIEQLDENGEISPAFRDMIMYKFSQKNRKNDLVDKFTESKWQMKTFDEEDIPDQWKELSLSQLKFKLLEFSRKRTTYAEGFESYKQRVEDFLEMNVEPELEAKTFTLAMREMLGEQLLEFGFKENPQ